MAEIRGHSRTNFCRFSGFSRHEPTIWILMIMIVFKLARSLIYFMGHPVNPAYPIFSLFKLRCLHLKKKRALNSNSLLLLSHKIQNMHSDLKNNSETFFFMPYPVKSKQSENITYMEGADMRTSFRDKHSLPQLINLQIFLIYKLTNSMFEYVVVYVRLPSK